MKNKTYIFLMCLFCIFNNAIVAQSAMQKSDSLKLLLKKTKQDTTRCILLNELIEDEVGDDIWPAYNQQLKTICEKNLSNTSLSKQLKFFYSKQLADVFNNEGYLAMQIGNNKKALEFYQKSLKVNEEIGNTKGMGPTINNMGYIYNHEGNISKAFEYYTKSYKIKEEARDTHGMAVTAVNIGLMFNDQGDVPLALEYYHKALKLYEKIKEKSGIAIALNNIGGIYDHQNNIPRALEYYQKSLKIREGTQDFEGLATSYNNIAGIYDTQGKEDEALIYYFKSLRLREKIKDKQGEVYALSNIGTAYKKANKINEALDYFNKALVLSNELKDKNKISLVETNLAGVLLEQGDLKQSQKFGEQSLKYSKELGYPYRIQNASELLSKVYAKTGNYKKAFEMQVLFKQMADSISSETNRKSSIQKGFQYAYEKKAAADSVKIAEDKKVSQAKLDASEASLKQEKTRRYALYGGLLFVIVFAAFMFNRFKVTHKQKLIIELKEKQTQHRNEIIRQQKHLVEEKHKEITDSINYAERIQRSFLASDELLNKYLKDYFILFKPKDVVSGDFYWASELNNKQFAIVTADSTGHGVPGAIMSLLNITSLENAIEKHTEPAEILNSTRNTIINRLKKDGSAEGGKDGMDCSLISFDFKNSKLTYSAANNPIWIIRNKEIMEFPSDKMPVGKHDRDTISFTQKTIDLVAGDMVYAITDGMPDQFGGPKGKKYMYKQLKELLITISNLPSNEQKTALSQSLTDWIGNHEQVDDITVIGIRV